MTREYNENKKSYAGITRKDKPLLAPKRTDWNTTRSHTVRGNSAWQSR